MPNAPVSEHQVLHFTKNVELLLQQRSAHLAGTTSAAGYVGKAAQVVLQFGEVEFEPFGRSGLQRRYSLVRHRPSTALGFAQ